MDNQEKLVPQLAQEFNEDLLNLDEEKLESVTGAGIIDAVKDCFGCGSSDASETHSVAPNETPQTRQDRWTEHFYMANRTPLSVVNNTATPLNRTPGGHLERGEGGNVRAGDRVIESPQVGRSLRQRWT